MKNNSTPLRLHSTPAHTHQVCGKAIRFFSPPNGSMDFPWASLDDLIGAMPFSREQRRTILQKTKHGEYSDAIRTVLVPGGETTIAPHYICDGLVHVLSRSGNLPESFSAQMHIGSSLAFESINSDMSPEQRVALLFSIVKQHREDDVSSEGDVA